MNMLFSYKTRDPQYPYVPGKNSLICRKSDTENIKFLIGHKEIHSNYVFEESITQSENYSRYIP